MIDDTEFGIRRQPTVADCIDRIEQTYKPEALSVVLHGRPRSLRGRRPIDLLNTIDGRRELYEWAIAKTGMIAT